MREEFQVYKPKFFWSSKKGVLITPSEKPYILVNEWLLEEKLVNLVGDLIAYSFLILIPISLIVFDVSYKDETAKYVWIVLALIMFLAGIKLIPETIRKLANTENRGRLKINEKGIKFSNTYPSTNGNFNWDQINDVAIKVFPNRFSGDPYLLFITNDGNLIDIDLSLLKPPNSKALSKNEFLKSLKVKTENFAKIKGCINQYLRK